MGIRIHSLAKELSLTSKELINLLGKLGLNVKGHMSTVDEETAEIIRHEVQEKLHKKKEISKDKKLEKSKTIELDFPATVKQLSVKINIPVNEIIKKLMGRGVLVSINQNIPEQMLYEISEEYGYKVKKAPTLEEELLKDHIEEEKHIPGKIGYEVRPPIVTLMGHVDHGKTSLLDYIRKTKITEKEKGGITQHIGAYQVEYRDKKRITFLDTPGHQAFTAMRARGAHATDIVVLVVACDDGVMPQTVEAIDHAKAAGVPIVVALNKCDLPNINPDKVKKQLSEHALMPEEWGGKTIVVPVSAKTGQGIDQLLEMLLLEAELLELKACPHLRARGVVIEGKLSPGQGVVATLLVKNGTLRTGDVILTGVHYGRVKAMINDRGEKIDTAPPSTPVEVLGLSGVPQAGDEFFAVKDERKAKTLSLLKQEEEKQARLRRQQRMTLEDLYKHVKDGKIRELKAVLKADVRGSVEALKESLEGLSTKEVKINIIHMGVGNINESDVMLALVSNGIVIGFHVKVEPKAEEISRNENVEIKLYDIIYEAVADVKAALEGMLEPITKEVVTGRAQVLQLFRISRIGTVAGCRVLKGIIHRSEKVRLLRNKEIVFTGKIHSLKHLKDDVREVREGFECGIALEGFNNIKTGDIIECVKEEKIARRL